MPGLSGLHPLRGLYRLRALHRLCRVYRVCELLRATKCGRRQKYSCNAHYVSDQARGQRGSAITCGAALWVVGAVGYLLLEAFAAAGYRPHYSYADNYISDLGVTGPRTHVMHAAFWLHGTLFLLGALLIAGRPVDRRTRMFVGMAAANAVGNIVVATVHSGKVHVAGAALAIVGGNAAILAGSALIRPTRRWYRNISKFIGLVGFSSLVMLVIDSSTTTIDVLPTGVWERGSVYSITLWQLLTAARLLIDARRRTEGATITFR
jgi:hypothetical membrane protein